MWVMLRNRGKSLAMLGWGLELEKAEHGVTSEVLHDGVLFSLPFSLGTKEPSGSWGHLIHIITWQERAYSSCTHPFL